ncbi:MAG: hypothetical protein NTW93_08285 [Phycisphaerae bacterium]|nr:hypothetical protein [Phycisphaerae bacterium]
MNIRQKKLVANIIVVLVFTVAMVTAFANIKNVINRSETIRATELVGKEILRYRKTNGSLPPEYYVKEYIDKIGAVRLSDFHYRAPWIEFGSEPNSTILAYSEKNYRGLVKAGSVVLWLNGKVEWMNKKRFEQALATQQKQQEFQWIKEHLQNSENQP